MAATHRGHVGCFFLLLPVSAAAARSRSIKGLPAGFDALMWAMAAGSPEIIDALIPLADTKPAANGRSALGLAAYFGRALAVKAMLARGWSATTPSEKNRAKSQEQGDREARCVEVLLLSGCGGEAPAFHGALRARNWAAAEILAAKAFSIEGLPALFALVKGGGARIAKAMAAAGAQNGLDTQGQDIFDAAVWRYKSSSDTMDQLKEDILALAEAFGANSSIGARPLAQRFALIFKMTPPLLARSRP